MFHRSTCLLAAALVALASCSGGGSSNNAAPRLSSIPLQSVTGGSQLSLDLATYVTDREGASLTYTVTSGGGTVTGSTYTQTFATMGTYTVNFTVADPLGKTTTGTFEVEVTSANLAAVRVDSNGLELLDTDTNQFVSLAANGPTASLATTLSQGQLVYQLAVGSNNQLWLFDTFTRGKTQIASTAGGSVDYRAKTSDGRLVFTTGSNSDTDLWLHSPVSGLTKEISASVGDIEGNPMVNTGDLVFYERQNSGQRDIYYYDPSTDDTTTVANGATEERLLATLPNGAVVLSRIGAGGETDLFYFKVGTGLVEIGADLSTTVQGQTKAYAGRTSDSKVVFEVTAAASIDLYMWNPATGQSRAISTQANEDERFLAVTATDLVVYKIVVGTDDDDLAFYSWAAGAATVVANSGEDEEYVGALSDGDLIYRRLNGGDNSWDLYHYDQTGPATNSIAGIGADHFVFEAVLSNDKVVYRHAAATPLLRLYNPATTSSSTIATGNAVAFVAATTGGDFVYNQTVSSQTDLFLWDESAGSVVTISNASGDDAYQGITADGKVLYTHVFTPLTNRDLMLWNPAGPASTRLTEADAVGAYHDHTVLGVFSGTK